MDITTRSVAFGDRTLTFELGKVAKQADGSTVVRLDDTMVLVTACASADAREGVDFLPLTRQLVKRCPLVFKG